jgi:hypothetical protein
VVRRHSAASVKFNSQALGNEAYPATLDHPGRDAIVVSTGLRANLKARWDASANLHGSQAKHGQTCTFTLTFGHDF